LIEIYEIEGKIYCQIPTFTEHQVINNRESDSIIPEKPLNYEENSQNSDASIKDFTRESGVKAEGRKEGREGKGKEGSQIKNLLNARFEEFYSKYPKKIDKGRAVKDFRSALKRASFESIIAGVRAYKDDPYRKPQFTKYPSSWLNADAWDNFITSSEARVATEERRTKDLAYKDQFLADQRSQEALSAPAPKCQHGNTIALCRRCLS